MAVIDIPFERVAELVDSIIGDPVCQLTDEVEEWIRCHLPMRPHNWMNNPWHWVFVFDDKREAMLFKLAWGGE